MNKTLQVALTALLAIGASHSAYAQFGDSNTTVGGQPIYVEESDVNYDRPAHTSLNINGAVGLPLNPTAQIPEKGKAIVQANYYKLFQGNGGNTKLYGIYATARAGEAPLEISIGAEKMSANGNAGFPGSPGSAVQFEDALDKTGFTIGAKYLFSAEDGNPDDVKFAIGAGYSRALYKNTNVYAVATKAFPAGTRVVTGHLGVRYDKFSVLNDSSSKVSAFVGAEVPIDKQGHFNLVGEIGTKNADESLGGSAPFSVSLRFQNESGFTASAGLMRQGVLSNFANDDTNLFFQLGKSF